MKKLIAVLLAAALTLTAPAALAAEPAPAPELVADAYDLVTEQGEYRIPQVTIAGPGAAAVNAAMWRDLYEGYMYDVEYAAESGEWTTIVGISYSFTVSGDVLSILADVAYDFNDIHDYFVYNVSLTDGERMSDRELFAAAGTDRAGFNDLVRAAVSAVYDGMAGMTDADFLETQRAASLADDAIARAMPYLDAGGALCAAAVVYPLAGPERYTQLFTLADR